MTMTQSCSISKRLHRQRGVVIIWFALLLPVLLGFAGLAIELARINLIKVELQNAADAAALAGAHKYATPADSAAAKKEARDMAASHYANGDSIRVANITPTVAITGYTYAIRVKIALSGINLIFGPFLGMSSSNVQATAIAGQNAPGHSRLVK
jgi:Flp pilus assembly protein TadG